MVKILFMIHDLSVGGAEKVLVNLVNNMNRDMFDITLISLFGGGINEQFLKPHIHYKAVFDKSFPGNSHIMKLLSPQNLHKHLIKDEYDIEVSYLEGPCARIISGCSSKKTKLVSWIHVEQHSSKIAAQSFRSYSEAYRCYRHFNQTVCVSKYVKNDFLQIFPNLNNVQVLYNTNEAELIIAKSFEPVEEDLFSNQEIKIVGVGKLMPNKQFDMLARIHARLIHDGYRVHTYILGTGPEEQKIKEFIREKGMEESFTLLGYQTNPYKYMSKCDLFVCASKAEGFSTAATEALIVGTPVCTVDVSGMKELLGENNEYGIVTPNNEEALFCGIKRMLTEPGLISHYTQQAKIRGTFFSTNQTVKAVEDMLLNL